MSLLSEDYPNGTWLGDENNPEMRVRCAIIPSDMLHISTNCRTAEKMALTLLDYLFHREVQAVSNLSGQGKHGKKQLDPLTIYGIRCKFTQLIIAEVVREPNLDLISSAGGDAKLSGHHRDGDLDLGFAWQDVVWCPVLRGTLGNVLLQGVADSSVSHP